MRRGYQNRYKDFKFGLENKRMPVLKLMLMVDPCKFWLSENTFGNTDSKDAMEVFVARQNRIKMRLSDCRYTNRTR